MAFVSVNFSRAGFIPSNYSTALCVTSCDVGQQATDRNGRRQFVRLIDRLPDPPVGPQRREFSGKFNVRVPKTLHAALASEAEAEGVSLN